MRTSSEQQIYDRLALSIDKSTVNYLEDKVKRNHQREGGHSGKRNGAHEACGIYSPCRFSLACPTGIRLSESNILPLGCIHANWSSQHQEERYQSLAHHWAKFEGLIDGGYGIDINRVPPPSFSASEIERRQHICKIIASSPNTLNRAHKSWRNALEGRRTKRKDRKDFGDHKGAFDDGYSPIGDRYPDDEEGHLKNGHMLHKADYLYEQFVQECWASFIAFYPLEVLTTIYFGHRGRIRNPKEIKFITNLYFIELKVIANFPFIEDFSWNVNRLRTTKKEIQRALRAFLHRKFLGLLYGYREARYYGLALHTLGRFTFPYFDLPKAKSVLDEFCAGDIKSEVLKDRVTKIIETALVFKSQTDRAKPPMPSENGLT